MSFRLFVYYCAVCGGWAAYGGWLLGKFYAPGNDGGFLNNTFVAMYLGLTIAMGLGLVDALWILPWQRFGQILGRVFVAVIVGGVGGLLGGMLGHGLYYPTQIGALLIVGWVLVGILCGLSVGSYDLLASILTQKDKKGARAKLFKCLLGGTIGGLIGALLVLVCRGALTSLFSNKDETTLWSPRAIGFVALGLCVGMLVGLAQVILKEAWVRVEAGFRAGREMILSKEKTSVGRAEGTDIALFGDSAVEKLHAHIVQEDGRYYLEDNATPSGSYVNDQRVNGRAPLNSGDLICVGKSVLRFYERQKRKA